MIVSERNQAIEHEIDALLTPAARSELDRRQRILADMHSEISEITVQRNANRRDIEAYKKQFNKAQYEQNSTVLLDCAAVLGRLDTERQQLAERERRALAGRAELELMLARAEYQVNQARDLLRLVLPILREA